jgi:uncharacterized protein (TIGR03435 family)
VFHTLKHKEKLYRVAPIKRIAIRFVGREYTFFGTPVSDQLKSAIAVLFISSCGMFAQSAPPRPTFDAFEVATVKLTPLDWRGGRWIRMESADQLVARGYQLRVLIAAAYSLSTCTISGGPVWIDSDLYDVVARTPGRVRPIRDEQMKMLRGLLADRFQLKFHHEQKEFPIYTLTVAKGGAKLKESTVSPDATPQGPPLVFVLGPGSARLPARYATITEMAAVIQRSLFDRPVVDKTGLSGRYDFDLEWTPDETQFGGAVRQVPDAADAKPDLFAAIQQQLGLRLEAAKGPVEAMVIDHIERPTDN